MNPPSTKLKKLLRFLNDLQLVGRRSFLLASIAGHCRIDARLLPFFPDVKGPAVFQAKETCGYEFIPEEILDFKDVFMTKFGSVFARLDYITRFLLIHRNPRWGSEGLFVQGCVGIRLP